MQQYFGQLKALKGEWSKLEPGPTRQDIRKEIDIGKWLKEKVQNRVMKREMGLEELKELLREGIDNQLSHKGEKEETAPEPKEMLRTADKPRSLRTGSGGEGHANTGQRKSGVAAVMNNIPELGAEEEAGKRRIEPTTEHKKEGNKLGASGQPLPQTDPKEDSISNEFRRGSRQGVPGNQARDKNGDLQKSETIKRQEAIQAINDTAAEEKKRLEAQIKELQNELRKRDETIVNLEKSLTRHQVITMITIGNRPEEG